MPAGSQRRRRNWRLEARPGHLVAETSSRVLVVAVNAAKMTDKATIRRPSSAITDGKQQGGNPAVIAEDFPCLLELQQTAKIRIRGAGQVQRAGNLMTWLKPTPALQANDLVEVDGVTWALQEVEYDRQGRYFIGSVKRVL